MQKETISWRQMLCIFLLFIFGSSVIVGVSGEAKQDSWISLLLAIALFLPVGLIYARIIRLHPGKDFFEILEILFGKIIGRLFIALFALYALHLGALVVRNFTEFTQIVALPETPQLALMVIIVFVTAFLAKSGIELLGRWSLIMLPIVLLVVVITVVLALKIMDFRHLLPVMDNNFAKISTGAHQIFSFPFAETVLFLCFASALKKEDSPYKLYTFAALAGGLILLVVVLRNFTVLGSAMAGAKYFPSYTAARVIGFGEFLTRIEGSITMNFVLAGVTKITVCLLAASKGAAHLLGYKDYRQIIVPVALLVLALCAIVYHNAMEMFAFLPTYSFYALPFQLFIPLLVWIVAEIKHRRKKGVAKGATQ